MFPVKTQNKKTPHPSPVCTPDIAPLTSRFLMSAKACGPSKGVNDATSWPSLRVMKMAEMWRTSTSVEAVRALAEVSEMPQRMDIASVRLTFSSLGTASNLSIEAEKLFKKTRMYGLEF